MPEQLIEPLIALTGTIMMTLIGIIGAYGRLKVLEIERKIDYNTCVTDSVANGQREEIARLQTENERLVALVARLELLLEQHEKVRSADL
ncbi:MAG: hypothetical protein MI924_10745 [Chloroflexales bacterium]|nr:hypothetical protein [Chloroflexales bacterium]